MAEELQIAKAYVQIIPSALGIQGAISQQLGGEAEAAGKSAGNTIAGTIKKVLAAAGIGAAVKKIFSDAFAQGSELEQNLGGTEAVFGEYANAIQQYAANAYKQMGLSASDYMATANKMASLFQGSGLSQQRSLDLTTQAMQRAADVASVMGIDASWAMESIAGAAKGNFEMMDNLGVAMNATTLQAYALEKGINFKWDTASQAEKSELAMRMFMERTTQYAGNFAKEAQTTWAGSMDAMKGAYENLMGNLALGRDIGPSMQELISTVSTFLTGSFIPTVLNIITALPPSIYSFLTAQGPVLLKKGYELLNNMITGFVQAIPEMLPKILDFVQGIGEKLAAAAPTMIEKGFELLSKLVEGIVTAIPILIQRVPEIISTFANIINDNFPTILAKGAELLGKLVIGLLQAIPVLVANIPKIITAIVDVIEAFNWLNLGKTIITGLGNGIKSMIGFAKEAGSSIFNGIKGVIQNLPGTLANLGKSAIHNLSATISGLASSVKTAALKIMSAIESALLNLPGKMLSIGKDIVTGLWNGISDMVGWMTNKIKDFAKSVLGGIKEALGIHSPSTVFRDEVGKMMALGLGEGFEKNIPVKAISGGVDKVLDEAKKIMNLPEVVEGNSAAVEMRKNLVYQQETERRQTQNPKGMFGNFSGGETGQKLTIEVPVYLQEREIARVITPYIGEQMSWEMI